MRYPKAVTVAKKALEDHKADDIKIIDVRSLTPFAEYYVIATAMNERQLATLPEIVEDDLEKNGIQVRVKDGTAESGWTILDAVGVTVHIFSPEQRERIALADLLENSIAK